jgi:hypothetical protein
MTTQQRTTEAEMDTAPVACTLTTAGLAEQTGRWERLAARALTERAETERGLRLSFRPEPGAEEELRQLVAVENECCRWASWTVHTHARQIVLDVRSDGDGIAALHDMFTGLQPAPPAGRSAAAAGVSP